MNIIFSLLLSSVLTGTFQLPVPPIPAKTTKLVYFAAENKDSKYECDVLSTNREVHVTSFLSSCIVFISNKSENTSATLLANVDVMSNFSNVKYVEVLSIDSYLPDEKISSVKKSFDGTESVSFILETLKTIFGSKNE